MDVSFYESFRWLEEDEDLDLSLDNYHDSNSTPQSTRRRRISFRRTLSFNTVNLGHKPTALMSHRKTASSDPCSAVTSPQANTIGRNSNSRPPSSQKRLYHAPHSSTSSIDPSAQYYQDPEARLKLRVYLASPHKFDEAIEYGFPALEGEGNNHQEKFSPEFDLDLSGFTGTFLEDDNTSIASEKNERNERDIPPQEARSQGTTFVGNKRQSWLTSNNISNHISNHISRQLLSNREMTLKMTLTRPDLRTGNLVVSRAVEDPLQLAELPPAESVPQWESDLNDGGLVKKIWSKFRKRRS